MMKKITSFFTLLVFCIIQAKTQVPVREEPGRPPLFQNKYIRLPDVWIPPGGTLVHRVCNAGTIPFHVNDIEILSSYDSNHAARKPLPFTLLYENENAYAYQPGNTSFDNRVIKNRGPIIAELISGNGVKFYDADSKEPIPVIPAKYLYIEPGKSFYFSKG